MTPAHARIAAAGLAIAAYAAACGTADPPEATLVVAHEVPHPNRARPDVVDTTSGLDYAVAVANLPTTTVPLAPPTTRPRAARTTPTTRATTPTTARPTPTTRSTTPTKPPTGDVRVVESTAYCLTGTMANGQRVYRGAVAMNGVPLGSVWQVDGGGTYTVADRIGHSSQFDIAMPGDCGAAIAYGRRTITVRRVG